MQAVANLGFLQLAQVCVQFGQIAGFVAFKTCVLVQSGCRRQAQDFAAQMFDPARVDARSFIVFIDQRL